MSAWGKEFAISSFPRPPIFRWKCLRAWKVLQQSVRQNFKPTIRISKVNLMRLGCRVTDPTRYNNF